VANNGEVMRDMAIAGLGLTVQPAFIVAQALVDGRLINAMPDVQPTPVPVHAVYPQTRRSSRKIKAFVAHLQAELGDVPPWERLLSMRVEHGVRQNLSSRGAVPPVRFPANLSTETPH